jgi:hypothetical protein
MQITIKIDNVYEDGDEVTNVDTVDVVHPEPDVDLDDWAYDELFPLTGTGREEGDAGYFVQITECADRPDLVGREFEWGT